MAQGTTLPTATILKEVGTSWEMSGEGEKCVPNSKLIQRVSFLKSKRESIVADLPEVRSAAL